METRHEFHCLERIMMEESSLRRDRRVAKHDRRAVGRMLVQHLKFLQSIIDNVSDPVLVVGTDFRVKLLNRAAREFPGRKGRATEVAETSHCYRVLFGQELPCAAMGKECPLVEVVDKGVPVVVERSVDAGEEGVRSYEVLASPLTDESDQLMGIIVILHDVTERLKVAAILEQSREELEAKVAERTAELVKINDQLRREIQERIWAENQLTQAIEHAELVYRVIPSAIFTVDTDRKITSWNDMAEQVTGYRREEVLGKPCSIFALYPCTETCGVYSAAVPKPIQARECEIRTKDGEIRTIVKNADLLRDPEGNIIGAVESFDDITDRKAVENQLRTERDKFQGIISALDQGMHILNEDFVIEYQNEVLKRDFGDRLGSKCYEIYKQRDTPCEVCRMDVAIATGEVQRTEEVMANGRYYEQSYAPFIDVDGKPKVLILLRDVTEERKYQAETLRAAQLASIGELAAGVAHEINNPINGMINYAQVLLDDLEGDESRQALLLRIIKEGERVAEIVKNLLSFARQRDEEEEEVAVAEVLSDALALVEHQFQKDGIELKVEVEERLPMVRVNPQQLQQVFLNLLSNARHALNQKYSGRHKDKKILIRCRRLAKTRKQPERVRTEIIDHGIGIPEEIMPKIFAPFFSSKKPGEGTGLGLSISHGIISKFKGSLTAESIPGKRTTMTVELPAAGG